MKRIGAAIMSIGIVLAVLGVFSNTAEATNNKKDISAKAISDHECDSTEWHFVITQVSDDDLAPSSIHVTWEDDSELDVPLWKYTGTTAHYLTTENLDSLVESASASIYEDWGGQFNLSHGPCGEPEVTTTTTAPPTTTTTAPPPVVTTTTAPPVTTTTVPEVTTTTNPPTTTVAPVKTTSAPEVEAAVLERDEPAALPAELPFTGSASAALAIAGALVGLTGLSLISMSALLKRRKA